jgi:hypothetical protein
MNTTGYYERLRTVYEHHLDERVKGKQYLFPSPRNVISSPPSTSRFSPSSASLSPRSGNV